MAQSYNVCIGHASNKVTLDNKYVHNLLCVIGAFLSADVNGKLGGGNLYF